MSGNEWEQGRAYVDMLREKGYTDQQIQRMALERGWTNEQAEELLALRQPAASPATAAPGARSSPTRPDGAAGAGARGIILVVVVSIAIFALVGILMVSALGVQMGSAREKAEQSSCLSNMKQLALGVLMYCQDHGERMPHAVRWKEQVYPYIRNRQTFECPKGGTYAMNSNLSSRTLSEIPYPSEIVLLHEVDSEGERLYDAHNGGANCAYVDGHAKWRGNSQ